jgi:hypothetical protein
VGQLGGVTLGTVSGTRPLWWSFSWPLFAEAESGFSPAAKRFDAPPPA